MSFFGKFKGGAVRSHLLWDGSEAVLMMELAGAVRRSEEDGAREERPQRAATDPTRKAFEGRYRTRANGRQR